MAKVLSKKIEALKIFVEKKNKFGSAVTPRLQIRLLGIRGA
jgi:hypothetical protein